MKKAIMILAVVLTSLSMFGQDISGKWYGDLNLHGKKLRVVFNISKSKTGLRASMDSPDQKSHRIPVTYTNFADSILTLDISNAGIEYLGTLNKEYNFVGVIKQSGEVFPVVLTTDKTAKR
ncbi:MAG: hypothetical protein Q8904_02045 [Bacteroidota bacterium]|nr:hypothetical protein [Bacteroidota bacterium]